MRQYERQAVTGDVTGQWALLTHSLANELYTLQSHPCVEPKLLHHNTRGTFSSGLKISTVLVRKSFVGEQ